MTKVIVEGMMCMRCVGHVKQALEKLGSDVNVSLDDGIATLNTNASDEEITAAIEDAGYEVKEITHEG